MFKKIAIAIGIILALFTATLFGIPYFFSDTIKLKITETINKNLDAKVHFAEADLSLFSDFPNATVSIEKLAIINKAPFEGDTLVALGELNLQMSIKELFKGKNEPISIQGIDSKDGYINILFNKDGIGNYDIALKDQPKENNDADKDPMALQIQHYKIENFKFRYFDERSKIKMVIDSLNHEGTGDFTNSKLDLKTKSTALVSLDLDKMNYMNKVALTLDAVLGIDLEQSKYSFKENKALINQLPLEFNGFIQLLEKGQQYDLTFKTPTSSFTNFLGLIPSAYTSGLSEIKTTGDFSIIGFAKGLYTDTTVPKFDVAITSNNASFQYPRLPKSVQNIVINTKISNETGILNDTYLNINQLSFRIDQDVFNAKGKIENVVENPIVDAALKGTINLANLSQAYPIKLDKPLRGILKADVTTHFDMASIEKSQYQNIQNAGTMSLSDFKYTDENNKSMAIQTAMVEFNPHRINLKQFNATTGKSDLAINGVLENFYGFMFKKQELKGNFNMTSNQLAVDDFLTSGESDSATKEAKPTEAMKIPAFLNCTITAKANTVLYDNLKLKDVSGKLIVKDEKATLENFNTAIFGGKIALTGSVSTKGKVPTFDMDLGFNQVDIAQSFTQLDMLKKMAPLAGIVNGKINSNIKVNGKLDAMELTPNLQSISGDLLGQLLSTTINQKNSTLLTALDSKVNFIDLSKLNLNDLKVGLTFDNGKVNVKPFDIKYQDIKATIGGTHGFDQTMNYNITFDVPAKYLGKEATAFISKLSVADQEKLQNIPIKAVVTGNFSDPKIALDMKTAITNLTTQLSNQQKDKLKEKGNALVNNLLTKNSITKDSTKTTEQKQKTEAVKEKASQLLNGLFGKKK
ncbi:AsmA family protein [Flavobacterium agrisoli]|uniref:AsmA family protein n=1 Tax=Flavobacterium agrisoli TaxID=2793066 RepID=A0A934UKC8_9FLAO|nr:AsmA family protein [Flavobacterium agrisoli]MBK0370305.1 AsmA family protein [Flavobacterium agrisoli]